MSRQYIGIDNHTHVPHEDVEHRRTTAQEMLAIVTRKRLEARARVSKVLEAYYQQRPVKIDQHLILQGIVVTRAVCWPIQIGESGSSAPNDSHSSRASTATHTLSRGDPCIYDVSKESVLLFQRRVIVSFQVFERMNASPFLTQTHIAEGNIGSIPASHIIPATTSPSALTPLPSPSSPTASHLSA